MTKTLSSEGPIAQASLSIGSRIPIPYVLLRRIARAECVVFLSHAVVIGQPPPHLEWTVPCKTAARFESDLAWLQRRFRFISYEDVEASLTGARPLPRNAALLTFDDGYAELHSVVQPLLRRLGVPALGFLTASQLDNASLSADCKASLCLNAFSRLDGVAQGEVIRELGLPAVAGIQATARRTLGGYLRGDNGVAQALWQQLALDEVGYLRDVAPYLTSTHVREMATDGWSFGGHGVLHRRLRDLSYDELESEIVGSCEVVARVAGQARSPFAFPYTGEGVPRSWLATIRDRHSRVGLYFDVWGLKREGCLVWHRVDIDDPKQSIATCVRRAHLVALVQR
jgi:peptidoglycan/xylan/chitin deacetylase (PgdA/CDA1 family)